MVRLLMFLFGKDYEECKSCQTLKEQLDFEREEKKELTKTLLNILQPKTVEMTPVELNPIQQTGGTFARRRIALEERDRQSAKILSEAKYIGKPDIPKVDESITKLEEELGVSEEKGA